MCDVELGQEVRDYVTGFTGIATARTVYLAGTPQIAITPKQGVSSSMPETVWVDEARLEVIGRGIDPASLVPPPNSPKPLGWGVRQTGTGGNGRQTGNDTVGGGGNGMPPRNPNSNT